MHGQLVPRLNKKIRLTTKALKIFDILCLSYTQIRQQNCQNKQKQSRVLARVCEKVLREREKQFI